MPSGQPKRDTDGHAIPFDAKHCGSGAMDQNLTQVWAYQNGMKIDFSRLDKPTDNAFVESFKGTFRAECLNAHWFGTLAEAKRLIDHQRFAGEHDASKELVIEFRFLRVPLIPPSLPPSHNNRTETRPDDGPHNPSPVI